MAHRDRHGRMVEGADMFGPTVAVAGAGISSAGRPRLPIRLMVALLCLKLAYNESEKPLVERWAQGLLGVERGIGKLVKPSSGADDLAGAPHAADRGGGVDLA